MRAASARRLASPARAATGSKATPSIAPKSCILVDWSTVFVVFSIALSISVTLPRSRTDTSSLPNADCCRSAASPSSSSAPASSARRCPASTNLRASLAPELSPRASMFPAFARPSTTTAIEPATLTAALPSRVLASASSISSSERRTWSAMAPSLAAVCSTRAWASSIRSRYFLACSAEIGSFIVSASTTASLIASFLAWQRAAIPCNSASLAARRLLAAASLLAGVGFLFAAPSFSDAACPRRSPSSPARPASNCDVKALSTARMISVPA